MEGHFIWKLFAEEVELISKLVKVAIEYNCYSATLRKFSGHVCTSVFIDFIILNSSGTNLEALINSTNKPTSYAQIVLVVSNKAGVEGLKKAERAGIPTKVSVTFIGA